MYCTCYTRNVYSTKPLYLITTSIVKLNLHVNMHLWMLSVVFTAVYGISRISKPYLKAVNFANKAIEGHKLIGSIITELEVDSERSCRFEFVEEERCRSINFETTNKKSERLKCQLSDSDRFIGSLNFTKDENFTYRGTQVT